ncbi:MAG: flagellar basal body rod protein FlgB [Nitrosomonadales bacterium]|nr:MAG: flagellar basal body rod protein FlgB [Nitrosomonadales bacterium]
MIKSIDNAFAFQEKALALRSYRQQLLASNIANADTPGYKATDINFAKSLQQAQSGINSAIGLATTAPGHIEGRGAPVLGAKPMYRNSVQPSIDGNTVDMNIEQAQFSDNSLHYMTTLQFINSKIKDVSYALRGGN